MHVQNGTNQKQTFVTGILNDLKMTGYKRKDYFTHVKVHQHKTMRMKNNSENKIEHFEGSDKLFSPLRRATFI